MEFGFVVDVGGDVKKVEFVCLVYFFGSELGF